MHGGQTTAANGRPVQHLIRVDQPPRTTAWKRRLRRWLIAVVVIYGVWNIGVYSLQTRLLFPTHMIGARPALVLPDGGGVRLVEITGPEGAVPTLVMEPTGRAAKSNGAAPVIVMFHGNAELARDYVSDRLVEHLRARGNWVVFPEYRGYGGTPGTPSQKGIGADMAAVADWVNAQPWCDRKKVVYFGWSLGSGVACQLASDRPPTGLILQSAFKSVASFAWGFGVPPFLVKNPYHNDRVLEAFDGPVLLIHGTSDSVVPVGHGRALSKIAKKGIYVELAGDHFHDWADWGAYLKALDQWLNERGM
jgi:pimeloyl-ACP methyl ester carboxylesterase